MFDRPRYLTKLLENGKLGVHIPRCWSEAVKKGVSIDGSSGRTSIFKGGFAKSPVMLKRAMCFGIFQFLRPAHH